MSVFWGCSKSDKPATQIVAKVNGDEITVHQVNNAVSKVPNVTPENVNAVRKEVLDKLINQQLAVQQAEKNKIDRSPEVMMMMDAAKREILTKAYLSQVVSNLPQPSEKEVTKFYDEHPELFAQRRIYKLQEIVIPTKDAPVSEIRQVATSKPMDDVVAWLKSKSLHFNTSGATRAAEQISLPLLSQIASMKDGETKLIESPEAITVVHLVSSEVAPVDKETAMQRIPRFLANEEAKTAINQDLQRLKSSAKIVYLNEFKDMPQQTADSSPAESTSPAVKTNDKSEDASINVEKGMSGL